jgi:predicted acyl esterase
MEVFADGTVCNIRGSMTTLAYRNGAAVRGSYMPGEVVEIQIPMWRIAWKTQKGSRLRVDISSSDFPQYSIHSNYPGIWSLQEKTKIAVQTIWAEEHPVVLELPVIKK